MYVKIVDIFGNKKIPYHCNGKGTEHEAPMKKTQRELDFFHAPIILNFKINVKNWRKKLWQFFK